MIITIAVYSAQLNYPIDLRQLCYEITNARYDPARFPGLWQHRKIGGNCLVFSNGIINCNGKVSKKRQGHEEYANMPDCFRHADIP